LKNNAHAICEKPLVLNPWNVDALAVIEKETGREVHTILQLRLHPAIIALRNRVQNGQKDKMYDVKLNYVTSRGHWYHTSWKGDVSKSGGIATNIGIHFFDMLIWVFGKVKHVEVKQLNNNSGSGYLELERAHVQWDLSIDYENIPKELRLKGKRTYRSLLMEEEEIEFSDGFTDLHTRSYEQILLGNGFGLEESRPSIELVHSIRTKL
jgi:UDP-N-acetyl-2-amino-2-deoxyglucuronate dehydrogenase